MTRTSDIGTIAWSDVIKKEARGAVDDSDFGEVQEIGDNYVLTQKGTISKKKFFIPKYLVQGYDGDTLWFNASEDDLEGWHRDYAPSYDEYAEYKERSLVAENPQIPSDVETRIPLIEERLQVTKSTTTSDVRVTKRPVTETKTVEVPVTHEELVVEKRPGSGETRTEGPVSTDTDTTVQLKSEQVHVTKEPFVREEVAVKKKPVTETRTVSDTVTREEVDVEGATKTETKTD